MKITVENKIDSLIKNLKKQVDNVATNTVNKVTDYVVRNAQAGFDRFMIEVPADDPIVDVFSTHLLKVGTTYTRDIECRGDQVLFIEFGAGKYYYTGDTEVRLYQGVIPNIKPRPSTIDDIGHYHLARWGRSRGLDDLWFYKSDTGRESENAHLIKYNRNGDPIMLTHGNRPARALYRAVGMAMRRLLGGKLK